MLVLDIAGVNALQLIFIGFKQCVQANNLVTVSDLCLCGSVTQQRTVDLCALGKLQHKRTVIVAEDGFKGNALIKRKADAVTHAHLEHALGNAAQSRRPCCEHLTRLHAVVHDLKQSLDALGCRQTVLTDLGSQQHDLMACPLELTADNLGGVTRGDCKGNQRGRYVQLIERAGHGVLTADGCNFKILLCHQRAKQSRHGLAPTCGILTGLFKIFLEGQVNVLKLCALCHHLGNGFHNCKVCAVVGRLFSDEGVIAPRHIRAGVGVLFLNRDLVHHCLNGSQLMYAAKGHEYRARTDGGVKTLGKTAAGADIQIPCQRVHACSKISGNFLCKISGLGKLDRGALACAVGV